MLWLKDERSQGIKEGDKLRHCPSCELNTECVSVAIIRTPIERNGKALAVDCGDVLRCLRCRTEFGSAHRGTFRLSVPTPAPEPAGEQARNGPAVVPPRLREKPRV